MNSSQTSEWKHALRKNYEKKIKKYEKKLSSTWSNSKGGNTSKWPFLTAKCKAVYLESSKNTLLDPYGLQKVSTNLWTCSLGAQSTNLWTCSLGAQSTNLNNHQSIRASGSPTANINSGRIINGVRMAYSNLNVADQGGQPSRIQHDQGNNDHHHHHQHHHLHQTRRILRPHSHQCLRPPPRLNPTSSLQQSSHIFKTKFDVQEQSTSSPSILYSVYVYSMYFFMPTASYVDMFVTVPKENCNALIWSGRHPCKWLSRLRYIQSQAWTQLKRNTFRFRGHHDSPKSVS